MKKGPICIIAFVICALVAYGTQDGAITVVHQVYSGLWGIMAVMFICTAFIIDALNKTNGNKEAQ